MLPDLAKGEDADIALTDFYILFIAKVVSAWTMKDDAGAIVPLTFDGMQDLGYSEIHAVWNAINGAALPNASAGAN